MHIGASYGDSCRYCGSTEIILEPASSSGRCALCSHEAAAWAVRSSDTVDRYAAAARTETAILTAEARRIERAALAAERRDTLVDKAARARGAIGAWLRLAPLRARTSPQP